MSHAANDLIAAVVTPPGEGGLGAIRVAGEGAVGAVLPFLCWHDTTRIEWPAFQLRYGAFVAPGSARRGEAALDEITAVWTPRGKSYTGDEQVEIFTHGGQFALRAVLEALCLSGDIRPAEPGEFTKRAFLSGRIDLSRAEAVAEIISAKSDFAYRAAREHLFGAVEATVSRLRAELTHVAAMIEAYVDFPEEDIEPDDFTVLTDQIGRCETTLAQLADSYRVGAFVREGFRVALCGRPNAGKSSLFNALLRKNRAIVSPTPGTTRDYLSEWITLDGFAVQITDTAGQREEADAVERIGQEFARAMSRDAHLTLWVVDIADADWRRVLPENMSHLDMLRTIIVANKTDLSPVDAVSMVPTHPTPRQVSLSCKTGVGLADVERVIVSDIHARMPDLTDGLIVTSARQARKLSQARDAISEARAGLARGESPEIVALDVRVALGALDEITGRVYTEDILGEIFSSFCVGK